MAYFGKLKVLNSGFTLIEIMVAITIMAVVFGFIITSASSIRQRSRDAQRQVDLRGLQTSLQQYYSDQNYFPCSTNCSNPFVLNNSTSSPFTNGIGNPPPAPIPKKTYAKAVPQDPSTSTTTPYCYKAFTDANSVGSSLNCTNDRNLSQPECHYYVLCAHMEGNADFQGSSNAPDQCVTACGPSYNYQITP